jgi:hypothetical protein
MTQSNEPTICNHNKKELGYSQWMRWAEEHESAGITQTQCPICKLWLYPEEFEPLSDNQQKKKDGTEGNKAIKEQ